MLVRPPHPPGDATSIRLHGVDYLGEPIAITATVDGDVILWDRSLVGIDEGFGDARDKKAVCVLRLAT